MTNARPTHTSAEQTDIVVIGSGFGGAITAYHLAAGGAKVVVLERGPWVPSDEFDHGFELGTSSTRIFDFVAGDGMSVLGGNCVGGGSVVYFATMPRAPGFVFERQGSIGRRMWPSVINRDTLDPWYDRVTEALPISHQTWEQVPYPGGLWAAACNHAGRTANLPNVAIDVSKCTNCNWMMAGCRFDAKRSLLLNYLPAAVSHGAQIRPLHEVQKISKADGLYRVHYNVIDDEDYRVTTGGGTIDAKIVIVAAGAGATPVILHALEEAPEVTSALVMVQREVADRLVATPNTAAYGAVSVRVAYFAQASIVGQVPASVFIPRPKVESALVHIVRRDTPAVDPALVPYERFDAVVRAGCAAGHRQPEKKPSVVFVFHFGLGKAAPPGREGNLRDPMTRSGWSRRPASGPAASTLPSSRSMTQYAASACSPVT